MPSDSITLASKLGTSVAHSLVILVLTVAHAGDPNRQHLPKSIAVINMGEEEHCNNRNERMHIAIRRSKI